MGLAAAQHIDPGPTHRLGRYTLRYRVAQGGMASVYLARLTAQTTSGAFGKWVALKTIHPHIATQPRFVTMFLDEARLAARLDHPNLCSVFDFGEESGTYFLAMEYLHGETLGGLARHVWSSGSPMPYELAARAVADAARGLHAAHELCLPNGSPAGVVHRDVSPENLFVTYTGTTKVVDFGVARSNQQADHTHTGELKGKVAYMSPEQIRELGTDRRTDVWALGVVLWEVTVGKRLFRRDSDAETLFAVLRDPIPRPSSIRRGYPASLEAVVMWALVRDPAERCPSAQEFARALDGWVAAAGLPSGAPELAEFMQTYFADQKAFRDELLRRGAESRGPVEDLVEVWQSASPPVLPPPPPRPNEPEIEAEADISATHPITDAEAAFLLTRHTGRRVPSDPPPAYHEHEHEPEALPSDPPSQPLLLTRSSPGARSSPNARPNHAARSMTRRKAARASRAWLLLAIVLGVLGAIFAWQWSQRPSLRSLGAPSVQGALRARHPVRADYSRQRALPLPRLPASS